MRTLAIGDIHGCLNSLRSIVQQANLSPEDRLILMGDYVDRGQDSRGVIDWILKKRGSMKIITLKGNHELIMVQAAKSMANYGFWVSCGGVQTLTSYGADMKTLFDWKTIIPQSHWNFIHETLYYYETEEMIFAHASVDSDLSLNDQNEATLLWERYFDMDPHRSGKKVICGHTPQESGLPGVFDFGYCIDTGACYGGWLTCLDVESLDYWQANEEGEKRSGILKHSP